MIRSAGAIAPHVSRMSPRIPPLTSVTCRAGWVALFRRNARRIAGLDRNRAVIAASRGSPRNERPLRRPGPAGDRIPPTLIAPRAPGRLTQPCDHGFRPGIAPASLGQDQRERRTAQGSPIDRCQQTPSPRGACRRLLADQDAGLLDRRLHGHAVEREGRSAAGVDLLSPACLSHRAQSLRHRASCSSVMSARPARSRLPLAVGQEWGAQTGNSSSLHQRLVLQWGTSASAKTGEIERVPGEVGGFSSATTENARVPGTPCASPRDGARATAAPRTGGPRSGPPGDRHADGAVRRAGQGIERRDQAPAASPGPRS